MGYDDQRSWQGEMDYAGLEEVRWSYSDELNVSIGTNGHLPCSDLADVVYAKLEPGQALRLHRHNKSPDSYEAFFFFQGARVQVMLDNEERQEIRNDKPFHLTFYGSEVHGIINLAKIPLVFEVLSAPRHLPGEESFM